MEGFGYINLYLFEMSDTGWVSPGTVVSDNTVGTVAWSNPSNATASDDSWACAKYISSLYTIFDSTVKLIDETGVVVGNNKATGNTLDTSDTYREYGGTDDLWGVSWSASDINDSEFGVVFQVNFDYIGPTYTEYLKATNFGFEIPTGATIDGVEVRIEQKYVYTGSTLPPEPPMEEYFEVFVDHIQIKVYYTESGTPTVGVKYPLPAFKRS